MNALVIRADGNSRVGYGHAMRCLALGQAWQDAGGDVVFVTADRDAWLSRRFADEGMRHVVLADRCSKEVGQIDALTSFAAAVSAEWVVMDGYHFTTANHSRVRDAGLSLLVVDDHAHIDRYDCDVLLNQNHGVSADLYESAGDIGRVLTGSRFSLLRREFRRSFAARSYDGGLREIVVSLGGCAWAIPVTCQILEGMGQAELSGGCRVRLVLPSDLSTADAADVAAAIDRCGLSCRVEQQVADMSVVFEQADLAIGAAGATSWERALTGLPSLMVTLADNQQIVAEQVSASGAAYHLGWHDDVTASDVASVVRCLDQSPGDREKMSAAARALLDPWGADRVVQAMTGSQLRLRPATMEDCRLVWSWANEPHTREMSFSGVESIPLDQHEEWYRGKQQSSACHHWIACLADDTPIGQIRFDIDGAVAVVSVTLVPEHRGRGFGRQIIQLGTQRLMRETPVEVVEALIRPDNAASLHVFRKCGFVQVADTLVNGMTGLRMLRGRASQKAA